MCDDIMRRVAGDCVTTGEALLADYRCLCVKDEEYPAIAGRNGFVTHGVLYDGITENGFAHLDDFEGEMYERITVTVSLAAGQTVDAFVYVFRPEFGHLLTDRDWEFEQFLKTGKSAFVTRYVGFSKI